MAMSQTQAPLFQDEAVVNAMGGAGVREIISALTDASFNDSKNNAELQRELYQKYKLADKTIETFQIGKITDDIIESLQKNEPDKINSNSLSALGLCHFQDLHLSNEIFIPFPDVNGSLVGFYARHFHELARNDIVQTFNNEQVSFLHRECLYLNREVVLCENALDLFKLFEARIFNGLSIMGPRSINAVQLGELRKYGVQRVILAFQNTVDSNEAANELADILENMNIACRRMKLPEGKSLRDIQVDGDYGSEKNNIRDLYEMAENANRILLDDSSPHFKTWKYDLTTLSGICNFYIFEIAYVRPNFAWTIAAPALDNFRRWLIKNVESPGALSPSTLSSYELYLALAQRNRKGDYLVHKTQETRYREAKLMFETLEAYGVISITGEPCVPKRVLH